MGIFLPQKKLGGFCIQKQFSNFTAEEIGKALFFSRREAMEPEKHFSTFIRTTMRLEKHFSEIFKRQQIIYSLKSSVMAKKISNIAVTALSNGAHFNYMQVTLERASESEAVKTKAAGEISKLQAAFEVEDKELKTMTKSELTKQISEYDAQRDSDYFSIKIFVNRFLTFQTGDVKKAAERLWNLIESYKIDPNEQLDKQTGMTTNFIDDLEKKFATEVTTLGLTLLVNDMKEANNQVRTLMKSRDTESSAKIAGAMKAARAATDTAYRALVEKVNALAVVEGDTEYASFIDEMNAQITRYKREALNQKASSTTTGDSTTPDSDAPVVDDETEDEGGSTGEDYTPDVM